ncbi:alpha/beta hydrolase-fold protein [Sinomicrobium weinanense]|uniref:Dienelactone hydrolase family protein n=1 Tax=Sinomicrobium weinanense TaxID=2842200 RepID=A0A926JTD3_9FLAO|nr:alpha/beta hydrolase-fold protein [Sinomicrobium weinanense]MBC9797014.1 dienelactone hydrolase family protein [Sinomicrobium weinanense]MBU3123288.1 dienelactone hydrolase family protein [Sinomicrobium weinanense]
MNNRTVFPVLCLMLYTLLSFAQTDSLYQKKELVSENDTLLYRVLYPEDFSPNKKYPVILFLHGAGERGNDNEAQLVHGSKMFLQDSIRENFPAIVIFPQCPKEDYWANAKVRRNKTPLTIKFRYGRKPTKPLSLVIQLMDSITAEPYVKQDQVYVLGLSMGGMGTFELLYRKPEMFAAAIPICGGGKPKSVKKYASRLPLWIFHGAKDNVVNPVFSVHMVERLLQEGGNPRFTLYENANHNSWDPAFAEPDLLPWLFSKTLKN